MANRFDILKGKLPEKSVNTIDGIAQDILEEVRSQQTFSKGMTLSIKGPNGFQVCIPARNIRFHQRVHDSRYEFHLEMPENIGMALAEDIRQKNSTAETASPLPLENRPRQRYRPGDRIQLYPEFPTPGGSYDGGVS
jgi:hypothetical protein